MGRNIITFELRAGKDDTLATALENAVTVDTTQSSVIREALRRHLFGTPVNARQVLQAPDVKVNLQAAEKDDAQLDDALDSLLDF